MYTLQEYGWFNGTKSNPGVFLKVSLSDEKFGSVKKLYIECLQDNTIRIEDQRRMHSKIQCDVVSIDTDHSPFFSATNQLVEVMLKNNHI